MAPRDRSWVRRSGVRLDADPARVAATIFLPGQELAAGGASRLSAVMDRVLSLSELLPAYATDGVHPVAAGYAVMRPIAERAIAEAEARTRVRTKRR